MRKLLSGLIASGLLVGCGVFGTTDPPADPPAAPGTPQDNAQPPPVDGSPIPGVYVSTSLGNDEGSGTASRPLKTLKKAFALANEQHLRVIACAEVYEESLTLIDGVSAYGYYECAVTPWKRGERRAIVKAPSSPAVLAKGLKLPTRLEGFEVRAPDLDGTPATGRTGTSVAFEARDSRELVISGCLLHGGKGAPGIDGAAATANAYVGSPDGAPGVDQGAGTCNPSMQICTPKRVKGAPGGKTTCMVGDPGGPGGDGGDGGWYDTVNGGCYPATATAAHGKPLAASPGVTAAGGVPGAGGTGSGGENGALGLDGASGAWSFDAEGFVIGDGTAGGLGAPGGGGGGGGGQPNYGNSNTCPTGMGLPPFLQASTGGGGGAGGCIGLASKPGTGGGASVGLLVLASSVSVEGSRIETAAGGRAGRGYLGGAGLDGGNGGPLAVFAGRGGQGGRGGAAGISGHGAPGPSIALAYSGVRPVLDKVDLAPGPAGAGWPAEPLVVSGGVTIKTLPAVVGASMAELGIKP